MIKGSKFHTNINFFLILAFFMHGILYFVFPTEIDNTNSFIKYIKYILVISFIIINYHMIKSRDILFVLIFMNVSFIFYFLNDSTGLNNIYILFFLPIIFIYLLRNTFNNTKMILQSTIYIYIVISIFAYLEYTIFKGIFPRFGVGDFGYRVSSILVNPNNFGLTVVFMTIMLHTMITKPFFKKIILLNTVILIYFSMSKTAFILFIVYILYKYIKLIPLFVIIGAIYISLTFDTLFIDDKYLTSSSIRGDMNNDFFILANENILLPFWNSYQYTDNIYLQLWGFFGLFFLLIFFLFNQALFIIFFTFKQYTNVIVLFLFLLAGLTTNYLYLWPLAYMYWGFVFYNTNKYFLKLSKNI